MSFKRRHFLLLTSCLSALVPQYALANPEDGVVAAGAATIHSAGNTLTINQSTDRAVIDWRRFNIAPNETTRFNQPSSTSHTLNRVNDTSRSVIDGTISANGNITIVNPNGVFFSRGSVVDVAGLTATSADTSNANFMAGRVQHDIAGSASAKIINEGSITVRDAGLAAFVAPGVENHGTITARLGKVKLAAGETFALDMAGDGHMQVGVNADTLHTQVANSGMIVADGGSVLLTTAAARNVVDSLITNTGVIEAKSIGSQAGKVVLYAEGSNAVRNNIAANKGAKTGSSTVIHSGKIDVSGLNAGERGGKAEVLADNVALTRTSTINASGHSGGGDIKVGGDYQGSGATAAAKRVFVESGASIANNATHSGNGGRSIFWSDDRTQFAGNVSATSVNGTGGFTEVSGKNMLGFSGSVDLRSLNGTQGTLLLDPTDITISTSADSGSMVWTGTQFEDTTTGLSNLNTTTLQNQLALSNVIVTTASGQLASGTIDVLNPITWNSGYNLTLDATSDITVRANIVNSGSGDITLNAGGDFWLRNAAMLDAGSGEIVINAAGMYENSTSTTPFTATGITLNTPIFFLNGTGGTRTLNAKTGTLTINGAIDSNTITDLNLRADEMAINAAISSVNRISAASFTASQTIGIAGAAGDLEIDNTELNFITAGGGSYFGYLPGVSEHTGNINVGARTWGAAITNVSFLSNSGLIDIQGAQTVNSNLTIRGADLAIGGALTGPGSLTLGSTGSLTVAGAAGANTLDTTELNYLTNGWGVLSVVANNDITANAYSNWRDFMQLSSGGTLTIAGAQTSEAGSGAGIDIGGANLLINADIDFSNTGYIRVQPGGAPNTATLNANLLANGIDIRRALTLGGAAGTTRTINAGTGILTVRNDGVSWSGSIAAGDRRLQLIASDVDIQGAISAVNGTIDMATTNVFIAGANVTMGLGGGAGAYQLSDAELDLLSGSVVNIWSSDAMDLGTHTWANAINGRLMFRSSNGLTVSGAQDFNGATAHDVSFYSNSNAGYTVNAALATNNAKYLTFSGPNIFEIGAGAAASGLGTAELDLFGTGWSKIMLGGETNNVVVNAYSNWRDTIQLQSNGPLTINGVQSAAAGSHASMIIAHAYNTGAGAVINADIDMSAAAAGYGGITLNGFNHNGIGTAHQLGADLISGTAGITIERGVALTGAAYTSRTMNAGTGSIDILNDGIFTFGSISAGDKYLTLRADSMDIGGAVSGASTSVLTISKHSLSRSIGLSGAVAGLDLSVAELDLITGFGGLTIGVPTNTNTSTTTMNTYDWSRFASYVQFTNDGYGVININGAQTFSSSFVVMSGDFNIAAPISNIGGQLIFTRALSDVTLGGSNAASWLNSTELDFIADGSTRLAFGSGNLTMEAYSNWRDPLGVQGSGISSTLTISGPQTAAAGSNASIALGNTGGYQYFSAMDINADVDFSGSTTGGISIVGRPDTSFAAGTANLGANLTSGADGIAIDRAVTLTGAAGATRTINARSGTFTLNNNGVTETGSIIAGNKNLTVVADSIALTGGISSTSGNIALKPFTNARTVGIGAGAGLFNIDNAELALLNAGSGTLTLGSATGTGAYTINTNHVFDEHVVFDTNTGLMSLASNLSSNAKNMSFSTDVGQFRISGNRTISTLGGGDLTFASIDGAAGSEIVYVTSDGALNITGASGAVNAFDELRLTSQGAMSMDDVTSGMVFARTLGATSDITLNGALTMLNNGTAIELVSGDDIINNHGSGVFVLNGGARFLAWSDGPLQDTGEEHFGTSTVRYSVNYGDSVPATGSFRNYSIADASAPVTYPPAFVLPDSVRRVLLDSSILGSGASHTQTAGTNAGTTQNAGAPNTNAVIYDETTGEQVAILLDSIRINPLVMKAFGLTYTSPKDI